MKITIHDFLASGYCVKGQRRWFAAQGFDFRDFVKNGIDAEKLEATGDYLVLKTVAEVRARKDG